MYHYFIVFLASIWIGVGITLCLSYFTLAVDKVYFLAGMGFYILSETQFLEMTDLKSGLVIVVWIFCGMIYCFDYTVPIINKLWIILGSAIFLMMMYTTLNIG